MQAIDDRTEELLRALGLSRFEEIFVTAPREARGLGEASGSSPGLSLGVKLSPFGEELSFLGAGLYDYLGSHALEEQVARMNIFQFGGASLERSANALEALARYERAAARVAGMDVATASFYRHDSAVARACCLAAETTGRRLVLTSTTVSPELRIMTERYAAAGLIELRALGERDGLTDLDELAELVQTREIADNLAATLTQYPNFYGNLERLNRIVSLTRSAGALAIAVVEPSSASGLKSARDWGFDLAVWDARRAGACLRSCGTHLGFIAAPREFLDVAPSRYVIPFENEYGERGLRLTLSSVSGAAHSESVHPEDGYFALLELARLAYVESRDLERSSFQSRELAVYAREGLSRAGFEFHHGAPFWREFAVKVDDPSGMNAYLRRWGVIGGFELPDGLLLAFTEKRVKDEVDELIYFMKEYQFNGAR